MRWISALILSFWAGGASAQLPNFVVGADVSSLINVEQGQAVFRDPSGIRDALEILSDRGFNTFRLRLWHTPNDPVSGQAHGLAYTTALAGQVKTLGGAFILDIHYSDTWADPGRQNKPAAWQGLDFDVLVDSVGAYTTRVLEHLSRRGLAPDAVQIGNEITSGMLWDEGRVGGTFDTPEQWDRLAALLGAGAGAVRTVVPNAKVIIHIDRGGDEAGAIWFFDHVLEEGVDFDWIGLSYYPWWHGSPGDFQTTAGALAARYGLPMIVLETAYPWTLAAFDHETNLVGGTTPLPSAFFPTPEGQRAFLEFVELAVSVIPSGLGRGWVYWEPAWIAAPSYASAWENLALFDQTGTWLHTVPITTLSVEEGPAPEGSVIFPNPARGRLSIPCEGAVSVYDSLGRSVAWSPEQTPSPGVYFVRCGEGRAIPVVVLSP